MSWLLALFTIVVLMVIAGFGFLILSCVMIGTGRALNKWRTGTYELQPNTQEQIARTLLLGRIAHGQEFHHAWIYDPVLFEYRPATDAAEITARAKECGEVRVLRWDSELEQFIETIVTADMPESEVMA